MKERVAVATVQGKAYFFIVNALRDQNIPFISLLPGQPVPPKARMLITTEQEQAAANHHEKVFIFHGEEDIDTLISGVKRTLLGKEAFEKIIIGLDPGVATGLAVIGDGKVIEEGNCYSTQEVTRTISKTLRNINFTQTAVTVKIGNGVPVYKEMLQALDESLPLEVTLEVVGEAGTNKPLQENKRSRKIRHISSAIRIAGRVGYIFERRRTIAANS
ncbi:MAG: hypothetical protein NWE92_02585 [Candidatus Bathyarchaeota archaeon]|nr:hypothetical protein [Candidatus Bathyarchaeota archaeon]